MAKSGSKPLASELTTISCQSLVAHADRRLGRDREGITADVLDEAAIFHALTATHTEAADPPRDGNYTAPKDAHGFNSDRSFAYVILTTNSTTSTLERPRAISTLYSSRAVHAELTLQSCRTESK